MRLALALALALAGATLAVTLALALARSTVSYCFPGFPIEFREDGSREREGQGSLWPPLLFATFSKLRPVLQPQKRRALPTHTSTRAAATVPAPRNSEFIRMYVCMYIYIYMISP